MNHCVLCRLPMPEELTLAHLTENALWDRRRAQRQAIVARHRRLRAWLGGFVVVACVIAAGMIAGGPGT